MLSKVLFLFLMIFATIPVANGVNINQHPYKDYWTVFSTRTEEKRVVKQLNFVEGKNYKVTEGDFQVNMVIPQPTRQISSNSGDAGPDGDTDGFLVGVVWTSFIVAPTLMEPIRSQRLAQWVPYRVKWIDERSIGVEIYVPAKVGMSILLQMNPEENFAEQAYIGFFQKVSPREDENLSFDIVQPVKSLNTFYLFRYGINPLSQQKRDPLRLLNFIEHRTDKPRDWGSHWDYRNSK